MASVLAVTPMVTGFPQVFAPSQPHPVKGHSHKVSFEKSSVAAMRSAGDATRSVVRTPGAADPISTAGAVAVTPVQDVAGAVTVVGVTWPKKATPARDSYQIRTLTGTTWSQWQPLGVIDGGPDGAEAAGTVTTGTDPYVVTGASKYEVRSLTTDAALSPAATVQVVDPGTSSADNLTQAPGAASAATVKPTIHTRAEWGALESLRKGTPIIGQVQLGFVHHTADTASSSANTYTAAEVPAMIRGMYAYHVQTLGWDDIGYNFLIDRFGRTWEGRYGGMDKAVVGAQTVNYNSRSTGVAAMGNFDIGAVPQPVTDAFKQILAWKLSLAGIPATGASGVLAPDGITPLQRVSGHRDADATICPGQYLYARLPEIRAGASAVLDSLPTTPTGVTAIAGSAEATVSWTAPSSAGGSAITGYTVTATPGGKTVATTGATTATVTGLTNGTGYTFTVTATNAAGTSPASLASAMVTPMAARVGLTSMTPTRMFNGTVTTAPRLVQIAGLGGVPADATSVVVNIEVFAPTAAGYVRVTPAGSDPSVAVQEFAKGQTISNLVVVKLTGGKIQVKLSAGSAQILMDVSGYYSVGDGALFTALPTARVFDGTVTTVPRLVQIAGLGGVPADATSVVVNTEVFAPTAAGYVRVTPAGLNPSVAVQEFARGQAISNLVVVKLTGGKIQVKVSAGSALILLDVSGYYGAGAGAWFTALPTSRLFDGTATTVPRLVQIAGLGGVPADATSVVVNTEVFAPTAAGYVRVTPAGSDPMVAVQEFAKGQAISNLVVVKLVDGKIQVKVSAGSALILMDVSGYYSPGGP